MAGRVPTSVALGELRDGPAGLADSPLGQFGFAKIGLAGCRAWPNWLSLWQAWRAGLPAGPVPVAVVYADWEAAGSPCPQEIVAAAGQVHCGAVLVDTFAKDGRNLLDYAAAIALDRLLADAPTADY